MKKLCIAVFVIAALYFAAAVVACNLLPERINDAERRLYGVRIAIAQLAHDQQLVSERLQAITRETLGRGKSKIEEVSMLLGDPDLNHIALTYMGSDWSLQHSAFLGQVAHSRNLLDEQRKSKLQRKSRLNDKIKELEARKRYLANRLHAPSEERSWHVEMADIDRQLAMFRTENTAKEYLAKDDEDSKHIEDTAKNEDSLFNLANDYQVSTVGKLNEVMAAKLGELRWEENEPVRWSRISSYFNIWPINRIVNMSTGNADEKRL